MVLNALVSPSQEGIFSSYQLFMHWSVYQNKLAYELTLQRYKKSPQIIFI